MEASRAKRRSSLDTELYQQLSFIVKIVVGQALANVVVWVFVFWFLFTSIDELKSWVLIDARNAVVKMLEEEQDKQRKERNEDGDTE